MVYYYRQKINKMGYYVEDKDCGKYLNRFFCNEYSSILSNHGNCYYFRNSEQLHEKLKMIIPKQLLTEYKPKNKHYFNYDALYENAEKRETKKILSMFKLQR